MDNQITDAKYLLPRLGLTLTALISDTRNRQDALDWFHHIKEPDEKAS